MSKPDPQECLRLDMFGQVISSAARSCTVRVLVDRAPNVGEWVQVSDRVGVIDSYQYILDGSLQATVSLMDGANAWAAPVKPGTQVGLVRALSGDCDGVFVGYVESNGNYLPISLSPEFLLGPEGAHVNASGISGLATKTSFLMNLLWSVTRASAVAGRKQVNFIINLKHQDLMRIHESRPLGGNDLQLLRELGLDTKPFEEVRYFASCGSPSLSRSDVEPIGYAMTDGLECLRSIVWDLDDSHLTIQSLVDALIAARIHEPAEFGPYSTWKAIWTEPPLAEDGYRPNSWSHFALGTTRRFIRHLQNALEHRNSGLFVESTSPDMWTIGKIVQSAKAGETIVLDFSNMTPTETLFCASELVKHLYDDISSGQRRLPEHVVVFVDELNRYGSIDGDAHPIRELLIEIAERGRSVGVSLFSAQQFASMVHPRIIGNSSTRVVGRLPSDELARPAYRFLSRVQKQWAQGLRQGEVIINHAPMGQPVKVNFPRPVFRIG